MSYQVDITDLVEQEVEEFLATRVKGTFTRLTVPYVEKTPEEVFLQQQAPEILSDQIPGSHSSYTDDEFQDRVSKEPASSSSKPRKTHSIRVYGNPNGAVSERLYNRVGYHGGFGAAKGLQRMLSNNHKRQDRHFIAFSSSTDAMMFKMSCNRKTTF